MSEEVAVEAVPSTDGGTTEIKTNEITAPQADKPWYSGLVSDESILTDKDKEYKSADDYIKATHHARQMAHGKLAIPGENATDDEKSAFKSEVMKHIDGLPIAPESFDKYDLPYINETGLKESLGEERVNDILSDIHKIGLSNDQADKVLQLWGTQIGVDGENFKQAIAETKAATEADLKAEWGDKYADRIKGIDGVKSRYEDLFKALDESGATARKDFQKLIDEVARGTNEDSPISQSADTADSIQDQIDKLQSSPDYMSSDANARRAVVEKLNDLYAKKASLAR